MDKKRVWCLYRVSTKKQISTEDDIPMQKIACHEFVNTKPDWVITNEIYEKGISGWKTTADDRDALNEIKEEALKGNFDILLVFMLDRLGRREDETPLIINFLYQQGIEVWSVKEGKRSVESHVDKLITYINFWQSSGESLKTSIRVRERKKQLSEEGYFQGGVPFGYKLVDTDTPHWKYKDRFLKELVIDEYESKIVKMVYDLYVNSHCGYRKIVDKLNENNYRTSDGGLFRINLIKRILTNKVYIGYKKYKDEFQPYNEKIRIIEDDIFYQAQQIREKRKNSLRNQDKDGIPLAGKLMFSGIAHCAYCGRKLYGNYLYRKYSVKDKNSGKIYEYTKPMYRYRCSSVEGKINHEKVMWGASKYDKIIISKIKNILSLLDIEQFIKINIEKKKDILKLKEKTVEGLIKKREQHGKQLLKLNSEIANSLIGDSVFTPEQLSNAINNIEIEIKKLDQQINKMNEELATEKENFSEERNMAEEIKNWDEKFDSADNDLKKAMISRIVKRIDFSKDDFTIHFKFNINEILNTTK